MLDNLTLGYRGIAQNWECDMLGHLNVSFYFGRASDQAFFMRHALALKPSQMRAQHRGTVALEEHARFHKEVRAGGLMIGRSAPVACNDKTMTIYHEFRDEHDNLVFTNKALIGHFDTKNRKLVPWSDETRAAAAALRVDLPDHAAPKFLAANGRVTQASRAQSEADGFVHCGGAAVNSWECDQFGHMNTMFYVRRMTEAAPHLWHNIGISLRDAIDEGRGSVVGEFCVSYLDEVHAGDMVDTYSALIELDEKTALIEHRLFNVETGALSALARLRVVHFDLRQRRASPWPASVHDAMSTRLSG